MICVGSYADALFLSLRINNTTHKTIAITKMARTKDITARIIVEIFHPSDESFSAGGLV